MGRVYDITGQARSKSRKNARRLVVPDVPRLLYALVDRQWAYGTTAHEYLEDLRAAVRHPSARIAVGAPSGSGPLVYVFAPNTTPRQRLGEKSLPRVFVLYGADAAAIITGYQVSGMETVRLPSNTRWLR